MATNLGAEAKKSDVPSSILDVIFAPNMLQEDQKCIYTQTADVLNTESILKKCNSSGDADPKQCDYEVSTQSKDLVFTSETSQLMMFDHIDADPVLQSDTETSSLPQMGQSLIPSNYLVQDVAELRDQGKSDEEVNLPADGGESLLNRDPVVKSGLHVDQSIGDEVKERDIIMLDRDEKEVEFCRQESNSHSSTKSDSTSHVHHLSSDSNDTLIQDSDMDLKGEAHEEANYPSRIRTNSDKRMIRQRGYIRFPFKHLLQVQFKRKSAAFRHKIRKR